VAFSIFRLLEESMTTNLDIEWPDDFQRCVDFHGHACPGLAMGYVAAKAAMAWLGERRAEDEEIVAIVETDACGADAVQVITGCTFGKGNFLFKDYGKTAFSFLSRASGKGIRLCAKPGAFTLTPEHRALFERMWNGTATAEDSQFFQELHRQRTIDVLSKPADTAFLFQEITTPLPARARVFESRTCSRCGESAMATRLTETPVGLLCCPCLEEKRSTGEQT
jgi:formylmethanofuran dehydrogenase subunit E